jgi:hypothetical protein
MCKYDIEMALYNKFVYSLRHLNTAVISCHKNLYIEICPKVHVILFITSC